MTDYKFEDVGRFVKIVERKDAQKPARQGANVYEGKAISAWLKRDIDQERTQFPEELQLATKQDLPSTAQIDGVAGTTAVDRHSFIYLDVGAWLGGRDGAWADYGGYKRDFGVVCGPHVLLCTFDSVNAHKEKRPAGKPQAPDIKPDLDWEAVKEQARKAGGKDVLVTSIDKMLQELSATKGLGNVVVARYLRADANGRPVPSGKDAKLHVIIGDMHMPVLESVEDNHAGMKPIDVDFSAYNAWVRKLSKEIEEKQAKQSFPAVIPETVIDESDGAFFWAIQRKINEKVRYGHVIDWVAVRHVRNHLAELLDQLVDTRPLPVKEGKRVRRAGRFDVGPAKLMVDAIAPETGDYDYAKEVLQAVEKASPKVRGIIGKHQKKYEASVGARDATIFAAITAINHLPAMLTDAPTEAKSGSATAVDLKPIIEAVVKIFAQAAKWREVQDVFGVITDTMTVEDAQLWYEGYLKGYSKTDGGKFTGGLMPPADIAEDAGEDFELFVAGLDLYQLHNPSLKPPVFHQLGDMVDLWMGFSCNYSPAPAGPYSTPNLDPTADQPSDAMKDFAWDALSDGKEHPGAKPQVEFPKAFNDVDITRWWTGNCLLRTKQGLAVSRALKMLDDMAERADEHGAKPTFLYGNHDCALGGAGAFDLRVSGQAPKDYTRLTEFDSKDAKLMLDARKGHSFFNGIWSEHGHQWDAPNADDNARVPLTRLLMGKNSTQGVVFTMPPFFRPAPMRDLEDFAIDVMGEVTNPDAVDSYGLRLNQIRGAVRLSLEQPFYVYTMGHSHRGCLCRVTMKRGDIEDAIKAFQSAASSDPPKVSLRRAGSDWGHTTFVASEEFKPTTLEVKVENALGVDGMDFVGLTDATLLHAQLYGQFKMIGDLELESHTLKPTYNAKFERLPPGEYVARYYFVQFDERAKSNSVFVEGVTIEGPDKVIYPLDSKPIPYRWTDGDPVPEIWARWAFYPGGPIETVLVLLDPHEPGHDANGYFALAKKGRPAVALGASPLNSGIPSVPSSGRGKLAQMMPGFEAYVKEHAAPKSRFGVACISRNAQSQTDWRLLKVVHFDAFKVPKSAGKTP